MYFICIAASSPLLVSKFQVGSHAPRPFQKSLGAVSEVSDQGFPVGLWLSSGKKAVPPTATFRIRKNWSKRDNLTYAIYTPRSRQAKKSAFKHAQDAQIQIILRMREVSAGPLLSIRAFSSNQRFC